MKVMRMKLLEKDIPGDTKQDTEQSEVSQSSNVTTTKGYTMAHTTEQAHGRGHLTCVSRHWWHDWLIDSGRAREGCNRELSFKSTIQGLANRQIHKSFTRWRSGLLEG